MSQSAREYKRFQEAVAAAVMAPLERGRMSRKNTAVARRIVKPNDRLTAFERLEIYNVQYWLRVLGSLREDFPGLQAALGAKRFKALCEAYLRKHPSRSFTLRNLGWSLPAFIAQNPRWTRPHTGLAIAIARFEWAQVLAFDEAMLPPVTAEALQGDPSRLRLGLQPYISLLRLSHPVDAFITRLQKDDRLRSEASHAMEPEPLSRSPKPKRPPLPKPEVTFLAVHRVDYLLYIRRLAREEFQLLTALASGTPLLRACTEAFPSLPRGTRKKAVEIQRRSKSIQGWFKIWAELGWLIPTSRRSPARAIPRSS